MIYTIIKIQRPLIEHTAIYAKSCQVASKMKKHRSNATVLFVTLSPLRSAENNVENSELIVGIFLVMKNDLLNDLINTLYGSHYFSPFKKYFALMHIDFTMYT